MYIRYTSYKVYNVAPVETVHTTCCENKVNLHIEESAEEPRGMPLEEHLSSSAYMTSHMSM